MPSKKKSKTTKKSKKESKKATKAEKTSEKKTKKVFIDVTKHELVPQHIPLSDEEKKKLLQELGIKLSDLPKIKISDPAIKNLNLKVGDVVKIIRRSPTAGTYVYYRVVIED